MVTSVLGNGKAEAVLDNVEDLFFGNKDIDRYTPVQFINEDIKMLNKLLAEGRHFFTQIKQEGVMLYDSEKLKLDDEES